MKCYFLVEFLWRTRNCCISLLHYIQGQTVCTYIKDVLLMNAKWTQTSTLLMHKAEINSYLSIVTLKGEMTMFYVKVIFHSGLQPTASHEVHTTPAERQKANCKTL